ncbi:MAG: hypothetical protein J0H86_02755 [Xanthomonadaceae bacterium]|nr:hypothetical protein [Xanthomonadaceae bacterium]
MKHKPSWIAILLIATSVFSAPASALLKCGGPTIRASDAPFSTSPGIVNQDVSIADDEFVRVGLLTEMAGLYRSTYGLSKLPVGSTFKMVYKDNSRECATVISKLASPGVFPVAGSQRVGGGPMEVENTSLYIKMFNLNKPEVGWYTVCYDYYSNGSLTATECTVHPW